MARGLVNALQLALGAVEGAASGYGAKQESVRQQQELQRRQRMQDEEMARQRRMDEAALREEELRAVDRGMVLEPQFGAQDMPGATPRQPVFKQTIGGKSYVLPETKQATRHRDDIMARSLARAEKRGEQQYEQGELDKLIAEAAKGKRTSPAAVRLAAINKAAYDALFPEPRGGGGLTAGQQLGVRQDMAEAEAWFNTPEPDAAKRKTTTTIFNNLRKANPNAPARELIKATYDAVKSREASQYKEAQTGKIESQTNPSYFPGMPTMPVNNAQLEEERKAFDEVVRTKGMQYLIDRGITRP